MAGKTKRSVIRAKTEAGLNYSIYPLSPSGCLVVYVRDGLYCSPMTTFKDSDKAQMYMQSIRVH